MFYGDVLLRPWTGQAPESGGKPLFKCGEAQNSSRPISKTCSEFCGVTSGARSAGKMRTYVRADKHERRTSAWLWRNLSPLAGILAGFWLFVIPLVTEGSRLFRGYRPDQCRLDALVDPFVAAAIRSW